MSNWNTCNLQDINFTFIKKEEGKKLITQHDSYIDNLTQQDLDCRCHRRGATLEQYLELCEEAVMDFTEKEEAQVSLLLCEIDSELTRRGMVLPHVEQINLVKVSGLEENEACGYTRGNTIYINQDVFDNDGFLEHLLVHELFHVLTRNCQEFKKTMYSIIGFKVEDKFFEYPKSESFYFASNPDVTNQICHTDIEAHGQTFNAIMMTGSPEPYDGKEFPHYFIPHFFPIDEKCEFLRDGQGEPVILKPSEGRSSYLKHIGRNTNYASNPEEVLAENFCIAVLGTLKDLPNPEIIDSIRKTMHFGA